MRFLHFDEAKQAAISAVRTWVGATSPDVRAMLIVDLFGKLRLVLWSNTAADTTSLAPNLVSNCDAWWTGEVLRVKELDTVTARVYDSAWDSERPDEGEPRFRVHDRHRSRTAWFAGPIEPPWKASENNPPIVVFYSFKGGLGRSTLLASFAIQLARAGERVCVVDFDLDSPGAGRLLSADAQGLTARWGVVDFLLERSLADAPLADYFHRCDRVSGAGEIVVFPAGNLDGEYADKLARIDLEEAPQAHDSGLWKLLARVRDELKPQWILLDARTGISEPAGQLLSGIAHLHVLLGTPQDQSWQGLNLVLDRLGKERVLVYRWLLDHVRDGLGRGYPRPFVRLMEEGAGQELQHFGNLKSRRLLEPASLRRALDSVSNGHVSDSKDEWPWLEAIKARLRSDPLVPYAEKEAIKLLEGLSGAKDATPPPFEGRELLDYLLELGIFRRRPDGRIDAPDLFLSGLGLRRKGGVRRGR